MPAYISVDVRRLIEAQGVSDYTPPQAANLAISGEITSAIITPVHVAEPIDTVASILRGEKVIGPPECRYTAKIHGSLEFYSVNPISRIKRITLSGIKSIKLPGKTCRNLSSNQSQNPLFLDTLHTAMSNAEANIQNQMTSSDYVKALRIDPKTNTHYYRLSIKPAAGAVPGAKVDFMETNVIDGNDEEFPFAKGVITCTNMAKFAYAKLITKGAETKIIAGTPVKLVFSTSFMDKMAHDLEGMSILGMECSP